MHRPTCSPGRNFRKEVQLNVLACMLQLRDTDTSYSASGTQYCISPLVIGFVPRVFLGPLL